MAALLLLAALAAPSSASATPEIFYGPRQPNLNGSTRADLFPLLNAPETAWPKLYGKTSYLKLVSIFAAQFRSLIPSNSFRNRSS